MERDLEVVARGGRTLDATVAGARDGTAVLFHNGTPGSRRIAPWWETEAAARGVRLFSFSRPGYGRSSSLPGRRVADVAEDAAAVADALGIATFAVWGHSGGGPHSLATAALLGDRVTACVSSAGVAPYEADGLDWLGGMGQDNIDEFALAAQGREPLMTALAAMGAEILAGDPRAFAEVLRSLMSPTDQEACDDEVAAALDATIREGIGAQVDGWVDDDLAFIAPWGFDPAAIACPVTIWQG